jgi:hypothetical protein
VDIRAHKLPKPFCDLVAAAYFLDLTFNEVQGRWKNGTLPRALTQDGSAWMPAGKKLVNGAELYPMLDDVGRDLFEQWQRDELVIPASASNAGSRDLSVRTLGPRELAKHGTLARYEVGCECGRCREAYLAYFRERRRKNR